MKRILISLLSFCLLSCYNNASKKNGLINTPIPDFNILLMDSMTHINTNKIPAGNPIIFLFFSPDCPYCKAQTEEIAANMNSFSDVKFYIISTFPFTEIRDYSNKYQLYKYQNVIVGQDYAFYFGNHFKPQGIPYMVIYTKEKKLKKILLGKIDANKIKEYIAN
jgi:thioredoxin-related protein